jgi:putative spermidine/putrescine transport system substrate-binding protein
MKRKAVLCTVLAVAMVMAGVLPAFATGSKEAKFINLYSNGSDNVRIQWEEVIKKFNMTNPGFEVRQQYTASGPGTRPDVLKLIAAWNAKQKDIDIDIIADVDETGLAQIKKEASLDALTKLDPNKIPNLKEILVKSVLAPDKAMPFRGTAVYIAYNSDKVPTCPKTEKDLHAWIKANPGLFAYNDPSTGGSGAAFVYTTIYNTLPAEALTSTDEKWLSQMDAGFKLLADLHPFLYKASGKVQYTVKNQGSLDLLAAGAIWMCPAWADGVLSAKLKGLLPKSIKLQQIDPALTGSNTMLFVPSQSKKSAMAFKFMNYVASPDGQEILVNVMQAIPMIDSKKLPKASIDLLSGLEVKFRIIMVGGIQTKVQQRWTKEIATLP